MRARCCPLFEFEMAGQYAAGGEKRISDARQVVDDAVPNFQVRLFCVMVSFVDLYISTSALDTVVTQPEGKKAATSDPVLQGIIGSIKVYTRLHDGFVKFLPILTYALHALDEYPQFRCYIRLV